MNPEPSPPARRAHRPRRQQRHTRQQQRQAVALYRGGLSIADVSARTGIPYTTLHGWLRAASALRSRGAGLHLYMRRAPNGSTPRGCTEAERRRVAALYEGGLSYAQTARATGYHVDTVAKWVRRYGQPRTKGEGQRLYRSSPKSPAGRARIERIREAARLRADGLSVTDVAARMGVRRGTVRDWLRSEHNPYRIDKEAQAKALSCRRAA